MNNIGNNLPLVAISEDSVKKISHKRSRSPTVSDRLDMVKKSITESLKKSIDFKEYLSKKFAHIADQHIHIVSILDTLENDEKKTEIITKLRKTADGFFSSIPKQCPALSATHTEKIILNGLIPYVKVERTLDECVKRLHEKVQEMRLSSKHFSRVLFKKIIRDANVRKLPDRKFGAWISKMAHFIEPHLDSKQNQALLTELIQDRQMMREYEIPVFKSLGSIEPGKKIQIPEFELKSVRELSNNKDYQFFKGYYYTTEALAKFKMLTSNPSDTKISKEQLEETLSSISKLSFMPWEYNDGCFLKADFIAQILTSMGISSNDIFKKFAVSPADHHWHYHVVVGVKINSDEWLLDLNVEGPCKLRNVKEWCNYFYDYSGEVPKTQIAEFNKPIDRSLLSSPLLFNAPIKSRLNELNNSRTVLEFVKLSTSVKISNMNARHMYFERLEYNRIAKKAPQLIKLIKENEWDERYPRQIKMYKELSKAVSDSNSDLPPIDVIRKVNVQFLALLGKSITREKIYEVLSTLKLKCELLKVKDLNKYIELLDRKLKLV